MPSPRSIVLAPLLRFVGRLRFPYLFLVTALVFIADLLIPDLIPFGDEIVLGLVTLLLGSWRKRGAPGEPSDGSIQNP